MNKFYALTVSDIEQTTRQAVVVTLTQQEADKDKFAFTQGQYLTIKREFDGEELRRSYSICSGVDDGKLQIGVKLVEGGVFSGWINSELKVGDILDVMPPMGNFFTEIDAREAHHYLAFAVGSGITPILSHARTLLAKEPASSFTLVYGNKSVNTIMFREDLEDLKNTHMGRFSLIHILNSDAQDIDLFSGRIDQEKCAHLFEQWIDPTSVDTVFICGPQDMMQTISEEMQKHGLSKKQIKFELFASSQPGRAKRKADIAEKAGNKTVGAKVTLEGTTREIEIEPGQSVLEAAQEANMEVPFACKGGVCATCKAKLLSGEVEMEVNFALEDYEVEQGYILTCQSHAISEKIVVDYDG